MTRRQQAIAMGEKLSIGVLLPVLLSTLAGFIAMLSWPPPGFGPAGQLLTTLGLLGYHIPTVALLNLWILPVGWKNIYHCFLAGMCVPTVGIVFEFVYYRFL